MTPDALTDDVIRVIHLARPFTGWGGFWRCVVRPARSAAVKGFVSVKLSEVDELYDIWCTVYDRDDRHMRELRRAGNVLWTVYRRMWG